MKSTRTTAQGVQKLTKMNFDNIVSIYIIQKVNR